MKRVERDEILSALHKKIANKEAIIFGSVGSGLTAKVEELAGIDAVVCTSEGLFRMDGMSSSAALLANGDANGMTFDLTVRVSKVVKKTPVIAGIGVADPRRDINMLIDNYIALGVSGVTNYPGMGRLHDFYFGNMINKYGSGVTLEREYLRACAEKGLFTMGICYTEEEVAPMVECGVDAVVFDLGITSGGMTGAKNVPSMAESCEILQKWFEIAYAANKNVITLCHGGPLEGPAEVQEIFNNTDVKGFMGGSSLERIPLEAALRDELLELLQIKTHRRWSEKGGYAV